MRMAVAIAVVAVGLLTGAFVVYEKAQRLTATAEGQVIRLDQHTETDTETGLDTTYYSPVVEYSVDGTQYTIGSMTSSNHPSLSPGQTVMVSYDPTDPGQASLPGGTRTLMFVLLSTGVLLAVIAMLVFRRAARRRRGA